MASIQLPELIIESLRQLLDEGDNHQFNVGDFICVVLDEFPQVTRADLIQQLADRTGADRSTLRDRHNVARFYPVEVRKEFDMLTYSQLRACKAAGEAWREYAEWAISDSMPAPVAVIRARIKNNGEDRPAWEYRWESVVRLAGQLVDDPGCPKVIRQIAAKILKTLQ
jgi:hypothetical protein